MSEPKIQDAHGFAALADQAREKWRNGLEAECPCCERVKLGFKLPDKPSELVALAMDQEQMKRVLFLCGLQERKPLWAGREMGLSQYIRSKMDQAYFESGALTHEDSLRAVQAALEKEGK